MAKNPSSTTSGHVFKRIHSGSGSSKLIEEILGGSSQDRGRKTSTVAGLVNQMGMTLKFTCQACDHEWIEDPAVLVAEFGDQEMKDVKRACQACESMKLFVVPVSQK